MNQAYDYLLTIAEGLLQESQLPSEILDKYFALKSLTFNSLTSSSAALIPKSSNDATITRLIAALQQIQQKGDSYLLFQSLRDDSLQAAEKNLVDYVESQMRTFDVKSEEKQKKKEKRLEEDKRVEKKLTALQHQNEQLISEIEKLGFISQQQSQQQNSNSSVQADIEDAHQRSITDDNLIASLKRENESLKSELRQHQQFHMESIRKVVQSMKRGVQQQQSQQQQFSEISVEQLQHNTSVSHNESQQQQQQQQQQKQHEHEQEQSQIQSYQQLVEDLEAAGRNDEAEKQTILSHLKVFGSKYEKLLSKYMTEVNTTSQFARSNEELAFYVDFCIFVAGKFETDNLWLISKLVDLNKQTELLEKSVILNEKKSFYDDLEQTYIEMKHEFQNTVKKQQQQKYQQQQQQHEHEQQQQQQQQYQQQQQTQAQQHRTQSRLGSSMMNSTVPLQMQFNQ